MGRETFSFHKASSLVEGSKSQIRSQYLEVLWGGEGRGEGVLLSQGSGKAFLVHEHLSRLEGREECARHPARLGVG